MPLSKMVGNLLRTQEILLVLFRRSFGDLLDRMGLAHYLKAERPEDQEGGARSRDVKSTAVRGEQQANLPKLFGTYYEWLY